MLPHQLIPRLAAALLLALAITPTAHAATIAWNFNNNDGVVSSNGFASDGVTANDSTFTPIAGTDPVTSFDRERAQRDLGSGTGDTTATFFFTINIGTTPISLTELSFISGNQNNARWTYLDDLAINEVLEAIQFRSLDRRLFE